MKGKPPVVLHQLRTIPDANMTNQAEMTMELAGAIEDQFKCCVCLDIFNNPVTIPCGHNFCLDCIEDFWSTKKKAECPLCKQTFSKRPKLRINQVLNGIIQSLPSSRRASIMSLPEDVPCDICQGDKAPSVKSCLVCQESYCEHHLMLHLREPVLQRHRLTDPASFVTNRTLCRKHNKPLTMFCKKDQKAVCEKCTEGTHKNHKTVPLEKERDKVKIQTREKQASIQQMISTRLRKMSEIKQSVILSKTTTEEEIQGSTQVCNMLITVIQRQMAALVMELEGRQREAERRADELFEELEQELNELQTRSDELQRLEHSTNPVHLLQAFPSISRLPTSARDWSKVSVHSDNCLGAMTGAISKIMDVCRDLADKLAVEEANKMDQYAVDVTLDPETASGWLVLSQDRKKVSVGSTKSNAPLADNPQRFDSCVCLLGKQSFTSSRSYWVVQVGNKTNWDLGVAKESINRKGAITVRPDSGYWAICRRNGGSLSACAGPSVTLHLQKAPQKVGIFLDYEAGSVAFFDAETKSHIYTYSGCDFTEPLYPYFNPCVQEDGKNIAPLVICPLQPKARDITIESAQPRPVQPRPAKPRRRMALI